MEEEKLDVTASDLESGLSASPCCLLTFSFWEPDEESVCVVDDTDNPADKDNEHVADYHCWTHGESAGHFNKLYFELIGLVCKMLCLAGELCLTRKSKFEILIN